MRLNARLLCYLLLINGFIHSGRKGFGSEGKVAGDVSKPVVTIMENLIATVELAEQAPDFVAQSFQTAFDDYADDKLEEAAILVEHIDDGKAAALIRGLKKNNPHRKIEAQIKAQLKSD